jgi:two-component system alkaline phosphatase synthesis response regulator PhoP
MSDEKAPARGHRILAADDENDILLLIRTALESAGHRVMTASNGMDALELIQEEKPDLIILDLMMPGMSGLEVLKKIKADETLGPTPVIMLTGISERDKIQEALDGGAEYYIVKPFEYNDLLGKVDLAMEGVDGL